MFYLYSISNNTCAPLFSSANKDSYFQDKNENNYFIYEINTYHVNTANMYYLISLKIYRWFFAFGINSGLQSFPGEGLENLM